MHDTASNREPVDEDTLLSYQFILGEMGIQMLIAILRGARTLQAIQLLSGVPMACVHGRLPVLLSLNLASMMGDECFITDYGHKFLDLLNQG